MFNVAAVVSCGDVVGLVPKTYLPNYGEFYEDRWSVSAHAAAAACMLAHSLHTLTDSARPRRLMPCLSSPVRLQVQLVARG